MKSKDNPTFTRMEAGATDAFLEACRPDLVAVLLGPAEAPHLALRVHAQEVLAKHGYQALVMETYPRGPRGERMAQKWERMLAAERPTHFFVVVPKGAPLRGAHVEFGYLLRAFGPDGLLSRVRFFLQAGLDPDAVLAAYETELVGLVGVDFFADADQLARRMARRIDNLLLGMRR